MPQKYREIMQRYCPHLSSNVVVVRYTDGEASRDECLSSHLCKDLDTGGCVRRPDSSAAAE